MCHTALSDLQGQPLTVQDRTRLCLLRFVVDRRCEPNWRSLKDAYPEGGLFPELRSPRTSMGTAEDGGVGWCRRARLARSPATYPATKCADHHDDAAATKHTHYYAPDAKHRRW